MKKWPWVTVWGILGGETGYAPWTRPANDKEFDKMGLKREEYGERPDEEGRWAW